MDNANENLQIEVEDSRLFVLVALKEAQQEDLFTELDDEDLTNTLFLALNELVQVVGGEIEIPKGALPVEQPSNLNALIGRRYHINIKKTAWKSLIACVPITVSLIRGVVASDPSAFVIAGASFLSAIEVVRDNLQKLEPEEVVVYLAVKAKTKEMKMPPKAADITHYLVTEVKVKQEWKLEEVQGILDIMTLKKVLTKSNEGYRLVV